MQGDISRDGWKGNTYLVLGASAKRATRSNSFIFSWGRLAEDISFFDSLGFQFVPKMNLKLTKNVKHCSALLNSCEHSELIKVVSLHW